MKYSEWRNKVVRSVFKDFDVNLMIHPVYKWHSVLQDSKIEISFIDNRWVQFQKDLTIYAATDFGIGYILRFKKEIFHK